MEMGAVECMAKMGLKLSPLVGLVCVLAACGGSEPAPAPEAPRDTVLSRLNSGGTSPDEFAIVTNRPLELNEELLTAPLPEPTPGGRNRADVTPRADALVALGGRATAPTRSEQALIAAAGGARDPNIRAELAVQDAQERDPSQLRLFVRWLQNDRETALYEDQILDPAAELARLRQLGVDTSAAPPAEP
ncbi:MAG: DUF3035 domain-containing protein [Pseudomonadota bacterium]